MPDPNNPKRRGFMVSESGWAQAPPGRGTWTATSTPTPEQRQPSQLDELYKYLVDSRGGTRQDWEHGINAIASHETGGSMDPAIIQRTNSGQGPGRGLYQFETSLGSNEARTAINRSMTFYSDVLKKPVPKWLSDLNNQKGEIYFDKLPADTQTAIFIMNGVMKPGRFADLIEGEEGITNYWLNHHWAGSNALREYERQKFANSYLRYTNQNR